MPQVTVASRTTKPNYVLGVTGGLLAAAITLLWTMLLGLFTGNAFGAVESAYSLLIGNAAFDGVNQHTEHLYGILKHFVVFALLGLLYAVIWPRVRKRGTWTPAVLLVFGVVLLDQVVGRLTVSQFAENDPTIALLTGAVLGGTALAWRYRKQ